MNDQLSQGWQYTLSLADGSHWLIGAGDEASVSIVSQLGCAMRLPVATVASESQQQGSLCRLLVRVDAHTSLEDCYEPLLVGDQGSVLCILRPCADWCALFINLVGLSLIIVRDVQRRGGILIHGALAERNGMGVVLAAPGGTGKTTASNRLPSPWRSLCDDATLVVRDQYGDYWAHPWPTWSRFQEGWGGGSWDVQSAVPLKGIFFLSQADADRTETVGPGHAASLLAASVKQAALFMAPVLSKEKSRTLHLERFNNVCAVARAIPAHILHITLTGSFWQEIEQVLEVSPAFQNPDPAVAVTV